MIAKNYFLTCVLAVTLLLTSFSIICVQNINRQLTNTVKNLQNENINLRNTESQLLLEKSTWTTDTRIEELAQRKLLMVTPKHQHLVMTPF